MSLSDVWEDFVSNEAEVWTAFHCFWLRKHAHIPILLVRYEDLISNKEVSNMIGEEQYLH